MASWFIVWFPVAFGAMSLKINKKDVTAHRIINSAKTKKIAWGLVVSHLIGMFVRLTHWHAKNISGVYGLKAILKQFSQFLGIAAQRCKQCHMYMAVFNHCFVNSALLSPL